jgi:hypothetical protein
MDDAREEIRSVINQRLAAIGAKDARAAIASLASDVVAFEMAPPLALHLQLRVTLRASPPGSQDLRKSMSRCAISVSKRTER